MEGPRRLRSGAFTPRHQLLLVLVLLGILAGCGNGSTPDTIISPPRTSPKAKRMILNFDGIETEEGRLEYLRGFQDDGYACWLFPSTFSAALCLQHDDTTVAIPETAAGLRRILWRVNLKTWLPSVLCSARDALFPSPTSGASSKDARDCIEAVEDALRVSHKPEVSVSAFDVGGVRVTTSVTIEQTPWVQAMARCMEPAFSSHFLPYECRIFYTVLACEQAKDILLPALEALARNASAAVSSTTAATATAASSTLANPGKHSLPSAENIEKLLSLLPASSQAPSLRVTAPKPGGRTSGSAVAFVAQYTLGTDLEARLAEGLLGRRTDKGGGEEAEQVALEEERRGKEPMDTQQLDEKEAGKGTPTRGSRDASATHSDDQLSAEEARDRDGSSRNSRDEEAVRFPPLERCEIRVEVDGVLALPIPLNTSETQDRKAVRGVVPAYPARCSEHPLQAAMEEAAGGRVGGAWDASEDVFHLEAREIERVCATESFGPHRVHAELSCCTFGVADDSAYGEAATATGDAAPPRANCEVFARAPPIEYFHTGNGADVYSSWEEENSKPEGEESRSRLMDPPPEVISVSLYLESAPDTIRTTVAVPRWSSDGEDWEAAFRACSGTFGPEQGVMASTNDCAHLVTSAIKAKRVDLYNRMSLRLDVYLKSKDPSFDVEGHTGHMPEKVEALGAMSRGGGERVNLLCEVGFNAGHSALNWLLSSPPAARVLAFDLGEHGYVEHALAFLQAVFPGRIGLIVGDSAVTVPAYAAAERREGRDPRACDVVFVDGNHSEQGAYTDLVNFQAMASRGWHALAVDDMDFDSVSAAWRRFREGGRGRLEQVVEATAEHFTRMQDEEGENKGAKWNASFDEKTYRLFTQRGLFSLGIGYFRPPPPPPSQDTQDA